MRGAIGTGKPLVRPSALHLTPCWHQNGAQHDLISVSSHLSVSNKRPHLVPLSRMSHIAAQSPPQFKGESIAQHTHPTYHELKWGNPSSHNPPIGRFQHGPSHAPSAPAASASSLPFPSLFLATLFTLGPLRRLPFHEYVIDITTSSFCANCTTTGNRSAEGFLMMCLIDLRVWGKEAGRHWIGSELAQVPVLAVEESTSVEDGGILGVGLNASLCFCESTVQLNVVHSC